VWLSAPDVGRISDSSCIIDSKEIVFVPSENVECISIFPIVVVKLPATVCSCCRVVPPVNDPPETTPPEKLPPEKCYHRKRVAP